MMDVTPEAPAHVRWVVRTLEEEGYETWAVGGAIRNTLVGLPSGDWDLATRAPPPVVQKLFPRTVPIGVEHGTVGVLTREGLLLEVTTFRRDVETTGRHAVVAFAETLDEDLARRDFTINAVAWHPLREEFRDPFRGRRDLAAGLLRTVGTPGDRFAEDYLRVLRGLRFAGQFRMRIDSGTWRALSGATSHLDVLSPERVREELMKILSQADCPSGALSLYGISGVLQALYPEVAALEGRPRPGTGEDLWIHSLLVADLLGPHRPLLRLAALLQGLASLQAPNGGGAGTPDEPESSPVAKLLLRLRCSRADVRTVAGLVVAGTEAPLELESPSDLRRWLHRAGPQRFPDLARLWLAKARLDRRRYGRSDREERTLALVGRMRRELGREPPLGQKDLALDGGDLIAMGLEPGPEFGEILAYLLDRVLEDPALNRRDILRALVREGRGEGKGGDRDGA